MRKCNDLIDTLRPHAAKAWEDFQANPRAAVAKAKLAYGAVRGGAYAPLMTQEGGNVKLTKGQAMIVGLALEPAAPFLGANTCPFATYGPTGCASVCLAQVGRNRFGKRARLNRIRLFEVDPWAGFILIFHEVRLAKGRAARKGATLAVRLNLLSDIPWEWILPEGYWQWARSEGVVHYDYTKWPRERRPATDRVDLTRSADRRWTWADIAQAISEGERVAVVARQVPPSLASIDGDATDERWRDGAVVVHLRPKGAALLAPKGERAFVK